MRDMKSCVGEISCCGRCYIAEIAATMVDSNAYTGNHCVASNASNSSELAFKQS